MSLNDRDCRPVLWTVLKLFPVALTGAAAPGRGGGKIDKPAECGMSVDPRTEYLPTRKNIRSSCLGAGTGHSPAQYSGFRLRAGWHGDGWIQFLRQCGIKSKRGRFQTSAACVLFLFALMVFSPVRVLADDPPEVLILNSYHPGFIWSDNEVAGAVARLKEVHPEITIYIEYLDAKREPGPENVARVKAFLLDKYRSKKVDLVIALDDPATNLLLDVRHDMFPGRPMVFAGVNNLDPKMLSGHPDVTGVAEVTNIRETLDAAIALHPGTREVLVVCDETVTGTALSNEVKRIEPAFAGRVRFRFPPPSTFDEIKAEIASLPRDSLALLLSFITDRAGVSLSGAAGSRFLALASPVPVYAVHEAWLGFGVVGGFLLGGKEHGKRTADIALRILAGEAPGSIPVDMSGTARPMFDDALLQRWGIPENRLPPGSAVVNRKPSILDAYRVTVLGALGVMGGLAVTVLFLGLTIVRGRRADAALKEAEKRYRTLFEIGPDPVILVDSSSGRVLAANGAACETYGHTSDEFLRLLITDISAEPILTDETIKKSAPAIPLRWHRKKDGIIFPVEISGRLIEVGGRKAYLEFIRDISERRRLEEELRKNLEILDETGSIARIGGWEHDLVRGRAVWTRTLYDILEWKSGPIPGPGEHLAYYPPQYRDMLQEAYDRSVETGRPFDLELQCRTATGRLFWARVLGKPVFEGGRCVRMRGAFQDITARKRAEEELRSSEERFALVMDAVSDGLWDWHIPTGRVYFSSRYCTMLGYKADELPHVFETWRNLVHPDDLEAALARIREHIAQPSARYVSEFRMKARNGEWRWMLSRGRVVEFDESGAAVRMLGTHSDVTERKGAAEMLRESEERFRAAFESAVVGRGILLPEGPLIRANDAAAEIFGIPREELEKKNWQELIHPDDLPGLSQVVETMLDSRAPVGNFEVMIQRKDGTPGWVNVFGTAVRDADGLPLYLIVDVVDISYRKEYEDRLRKYEQIVSASRDMMALVNRDYIFEAANASCLAAFDRPLEKVVGRSLGEILGDEVFENRVRPHLDRAFSGETVTCQEQIDPVGLPRRILDVSLFPFHNGGNNISAVVVNIRDITTTRQLEEKLVQAQKIESIGTLAGGVAHEINNPINGIMNYAQLIVDRSDKGHPAVDLAAEIIHETERVAGIVRNLLTFARHEKQSHSPAFVSDIVSSVLSLIQAVMRHDQIDLRIDIPEDLPSIKCRSQQIQQVLMNLLTNARDALNEKYPRYDAEKVLRVSAQLVDKQSGRFIRTTVEDSGTGIAAEIRDRIFDPFFTTKPKGTGTGLGLSISYGIVKGHKGELTVESEPGKYARFHIDLPVDNGWELQWQ